MVGQATNFQLCSNFQTRCSVVMAFSWRVLSVQHVNYPRFALSCIFRSIEIVRRRLARFHKKATTYMIAQYGKGGGWRGS